MNILIIHGPNLNILGRRDKGLYGELSLDEINALIKNKANDLDVQLDIIQSNFEGEIVDRIHRAMDDGTNGIIINPAAFTHYSIAIRDALEPLSIPIIEVHLSNIYNREDFRRKSLLAPVCTGQITGLGHYGYLLALDMLRIYDD